MGLGSNYAKNNKKIQKVDKIKKPAFNKRVKK